MKRTRLIITIISGSLLFGLAFYAVYEGMEGLASACVSSAMIIITGYIFNETKRPSLKKEEKVSQQ